MQNKIKTKTDNVVYLYDMDKILLVFICLISISNMYSVRTETIETWGDVYNVRAIEEKTATARWFIFRIKQRTLRFPSVMVDNELE